MRRRIAVFVGLWVIVLAGSSSVSAQVQGGLTALPQVKVGSNALANGGFETIGSPPVNWNGGSNWNVDQIVKKSGTYSWRRGTGAPTATQKVKLRKGTYKLSAWIKTETLGSASAGVRLQLDLRPGVNFWYKTGVISGTADWKLHELKNIVLTEDREVTVKLENFANPSGTAWFDDIKLEEQQPEPVNAFLLYPNYRGILFTDKPQTMRVDVTVTPPGDDFAKYAVRATLADETSGTEVRSQTYPASAHFVAQLDGSAMQTGKGYLLRVALVDTATGATVYTYPAYRVSRLPGSARASMNVAFDEKNRLLVRGTPRFLLGVYDAGMGYGTTDQFWEDKLWSPSGERRMNGLKLNFYLNYWYGEAPAAAMTSLMANLQKHGVMYLQTGNCFNTRPAGDNFLINSSADYVRDLGGHPGAGGFYTVDECISALAPGAFAQTKRLRELAPGTVTFGALFGDPDIVFWRDTVDVLSSDPYPMFGAEPAGGYDHGQVAEWTAQTRTAVKDARPFMTVLQFFKFTSKGRWPTRQEMRNHAYMAIVEGARGLWWWSLGTNALKDVCAGWCEQKTTSMNNLKAVVNELAALEPVLLADDSPAALKTNSNRSAIRTKVKLHGGKGYVFAYNGTNRNASATFTWNTAAGTVTVNGENRSIAASGSSFTDSFAPYQAHVYVIGRGGVSVGNTDPEPDMSDEPQPAPAPEPAAAADPAPTSGPAATPESAPISGLGQSPQSSPSPDRAPSTPGNPTVAFTNPQSGASLKGTATVSMQASGSGGSSYTYAVAVDGTTVYTGTNPAFGWNTTTVADGERTLTATVKDAAGSTATATLKVTVTNSGAGTPTAAISGAAPVAASMLAGTLPHRADFLTNPECQGFGGTTFYPRAPASARLKCREGMKSRGYTHMYISVASVAVGNAYYENASAFRALLQELVNDGIQPVVWLTSDTGPWKDRSVSSIEADLTGLIPRIDDLVSSYVLGLELEEYWARSKADQIGNHMQTLTAKPIAAHQQSGEWAYCRSSWCDYMILQYSVRTAAGVRAETRRAMNDLGKPVVAGEYNLDGPERISHQLATAAVSAGAAGFGNGGPVAIATPPAPPAPSPSSPPSAPSPSPSPPSPSSPSAGLRVTVPTLTQDQTVSGGSIRVTIRASGTSGSQNKFWISVDGAQKDFWIVSGSEINWWWTLTSLTPGRHTLSVKVQDATGKIGTGSVVIRRP